MKEEEGAIERELAFYDWENTEPSGLLFQEYSPSLWLQGAHRDGYLDSVYCPLKVFMPAGWHYPQVWDQSIEPSIKGKGL